MSLVEDERTTVHQIPAINRSPERTQTASELAVHLVGLMAGLDSHSEQNPTDAAT
jgi:hypothetical protein